MKVNLGGIGLKGFVNVDISLKADKIRDLDFMRLPFKDNSVDELLCMSFINYPKKERALKIRKDVYRVLKPEGICRFGVQDLELICAKYLLGEFDCERLNRWFGNLDGYNANGKKNKYVYDYQTLSQMFYDAGFIWVSRKLTYQEKFLSELNIYDNRPEQMFYMECRK